MDAKSSRGQFAVTSVNSSGAQPRPAGELPRWPFMAMFVWFPLWWVLGFGDMAWIPLAGIMALYLDRKSVV